MLFVAVALLTTTHGFSVGMAVAVGLMAAEPLLQRALSADQKGGSKKSS
jgi:hypothetical protein